MGEGGGLDILYPNDRKEPVNLYGPNFKIKKDEHQKEKLIASGNLEDS